MGDLDEKELNVSRGVSGVCPLTLESLGTEKTESRERKGHGEGLVYR